MKTLIVGAALVAAAACGKGGGDGKGAPAAADAKAANDAVPAAWKSKLAFEVKIMGERDEKVSAVVPKGWKKGYLPDELDPPDGTNDFGFGASLRVGGTCGGECKAKSAKEWDAAATESFFGNLAAHTPPAKIIKDERTATRRTMIAEDQHTDGNVNDTFVVVAWWKEGGERLFFCDATLPPESKDLVPAFEKACAAAVEQ